MPAHALGFTPRRRVGLLGGSFNPAHEGHLEIALIALQRLALDEIWFLVSPGNPLKPESGMAPLAERAATVARLTGSDPRLRIVTIERALGTRYTADTLPALCRRFRRARFVWLMGADNLAQIPAWARWSSIFMAVPVAVFARPNYCLKALAGKAARRFSTARRSAGQARRLAAERPPAWVFFHTRLNPASASAIRDARARRAKRP
ncbi:MAG: nicotinate-nucleotide adenylyltransferase [Alphaproteobacteria bacterium]|nr:nicotinate-nucleotide adenylyltransferase [Alphaproteobacteria bacterium]